MSDDRRRETEKRKRFAMSTEERDTPSIPKRPGTNPLGMPTHIDREYTPPPRVEDPILQAVIERLWPTRDHHDRLIEVSTELAVVRERLDQVEGVGESIDELRAIRGDMIERFADVVGKSGNNGKLGELTRKVDAITKRAWWAITVIVGSLGTAGTLAFKSGREVGELQNQIETLRDEVAKLRAHHFDRDRMPLPDPPKGSTP